MSRSSLRLPAMAAGLVLLGLAACSKSPPPAPAAAPQEPPTPPTLEQLGSATVSGVLDQPVTLANGTYEGPPVEPGAATHPRLTLWPSAVVFSDVDGKPGSEAIGVLAADTGGSGEFLHVAVFGQQGGKAVSLAAAPVGDRVKLQKLWVEHGQVHMDVVEAGPKDPSCCPTQLARKVYAFDGTTLKQVSSDVVGSLSVNLLASTDFVLAEIDGQPVPGDKPPTLLVQYGKVMGFAGCNRYTGPLKETTPGTIELGPLALTKMACPPPASELEERFVARMNKVKGYTFVAGRLGLTWSDKDTQGMLVFSK